MTIVDGYVDQLKPHMQRVGLTAQAYAERICSRLDLIYESVRENGVWSDRGLEFFYHPAVQASERITTLATDDMWVLTSYSRGSTVNVGYVRLDQKPILLLAAGVTGIGSSPIYIPGPGELTVDTDVAATTVTIQFRRYARRASNNSNRLGFGDPLPEVDRMGVTPTYRHSGAM
jgi:hypothetical protein